MAPEPVRGDETPAARLRRQIEGFEATALIHAAVRLDLPDRMGDGDWDPARLAAALDCPPDGLERLLRALADLGLCDQPGPGTYRLSETGACLRRDAPGAHREQVLIAVAQYWDAWAGLADCVRSGTPAFLSRHGLSPWAWRRRHPAEGAVFDAWLVKETAQVAPSILAAVDFAGVTRVADLGGGGGGLLAAVLEAHPGITGVLFDQAEVLAEAAPALARRGLEARVEAVTGDFFAGIPVQADRYLLKSVLHDWDDAACGRLLARCREAMAPGSRLLVIERLLPAPAAVRLDLRMMVITGGRERMLADYEGLLGAAGFDLAGTTATASGFAVLDARPR